MDLGPVGDRREGVVAVRQHQRAHAHFVDEEAEECLTETTVHVTYRPVSEADLEGGLVSPIGGTIPDLSWYILDRDLNPVPRGAVASCTSVAPVWRAAT